MSIADELLCAVLRGERPTWPWPGDSAAAARLFERIKLHGAQALLHAKLAGSGWPAEITGVLREQAVQCAMWEIRHQLVLGRTIEGLESIGVQAVVLKGSALAYSLYPTPALRARGDTDLMIPLEARQRVDSLLNALGYQCSSGVSGEFISYQASYMLDAVDGSSHILDLHWKINNSELLSRLFTYEELRDAAVALPNLCPHALGTSRVHALLLACMHRSTHKQNPYYVDGQAHHDADRLIWLYDIHLLAGVLTGKEWTEFIRLANEKGLRAVCLEGMQNSQLCFRTEYPESVLHALASTGAPEAPAAYLEMRKLRQQWVDFCALGNLGRQLRYLQELFFPRGAYMREKYATSACRWLPWLYLRRAASGLAKSLGNRGPAA